MKGESFIQKSLLTGASPMFDIMIVNFATSPSDIDDGKPTVRTDREGWWLRLSMKKCGIGMLS